MTTPDQIGTSTDGVNGSAMRPGRAPLEQTPTELVPRLNEFSGYTKAHFQKVVLLPPFSADPLQDPQAVDAPLDMEDVSEGTPASRSPSRGWS